jgi:hypothetical protein
LQHTRRQPPPGPTRAAALHRLGTVAAVLTFDSQLHAGCQHHGIAVEAPVV